MLKKLKFLVFDLIIASVLAYVVHQASAYAIDFFFPEHFCVTEYDNIRSSKYGILCFLEGVLACAIFAHVSFLNRENNSLTLKS